MSDEIINVTDSVLTSVTSTVSINSYDKKVRYKMDCLHIILLVIILLFVIVIICYHYAKYRSKQTNIVTLTI